LLALLGALAGHLEHPAMAAVLALFACATVLAGYLRAAEARSSPSSAPFSPT